MRVCPACDSRTEAETCPRDGRPTVHESEFEVVERQDPMVGYRLLDKYVVEAKLGSGGFGSVYLARHLQTGGHVAVKLLRPEVADDADAVRRFYIEAQNTHGLKHPNTVTVSDFGRADDGLLYLIMEHVDGTPLVKVLRQEGRLAASRVVHIIEQVLKSLNEAHGRRIVHRDIKPDNIMLLDQFLERDFVKVLDFGISRSLDSSGANTAGRALGTPRYMAPEQWRGQELDGRADLYSVGCMAYQMLAGRAPFHFDKGTQSGIYAYMHAHLHAPPPPLSEVAPGACPPELEALILSMLAKDRFGRPSSAQEVLVRLAEIRASSALSPTTTGHVAATSTDALPGMGSADDGSEFTAQLSMGPAAVRRGGGTTPLPAATLAHPQRTLPAPRLAENAASTGVPPRRALPPIETPPPVSTAAVAASLAVLLLLAGGGVYWATRNTASPALDTAVAASQLSTEHSPAEPTAAAEPPVPAEPPAVADEAAPPPPGPGTAEPEPEPAAAEPALLAEPAAAASAPEPADTDPASAFPEPAAVERPVDTPPEPAEPPALVINVVSDPPGAEVRRKGTPGLLGTTPFNWTPADTDLETLTAGHHLTLLFAGPDGETGKATLTKAILKADLPEISTALRAPQRHRAPAPKPATATAPHKPASKPKSFHF